MSPKESAWQSSCTRQKRDFAVSLGPSIRRSFYTCTARASAVRLRDGQQRPLRFEIFPVCFSEDTRALGSWHPAKPSPVPFALRRHHLESSPTFFCRAPGKTHGKVFSVCPIKGTRQSHLCRHPWTPWEICHGPRTAKSLSCVLVALPCALDTRQISQLR